MAHHKFFAYTYLTSVAFLPFASFSHSAFAADVPPGTKLAADQVLNVGVGSEAPSLDPQKMQDNVSSRIGEDLFEGLVSTNDAGELVPGVAEKWDVSGDGLTYTFHLRNNAKFSDGSPITAEDVVFSFQRIVDPKTGSTYSDFINMVKNSNEINEGKLKPESLGIKALDKKTIQINLSRTTPFFLKLVAFHTCLIVKKENVEKYGDKFTHPGNLVTSGAYSLKYWKVGDKITAVRNSHYWDNSKTVINTVNYFPISDLNTEYQMYQTGQLDFTYEFPADKYQMLKKTLGKEVQTNPYLSIYYFDFNNKKPPFKDNLKLRQALSMAIDRKVITEKITGRGEVPSYDVVAWGTSDYKQNAPDWVKWPREKQVAEAKRLYKEAGYSQENPVKFNILYNTNLQHKKIYTAIASMWTKTLGAQVTLENKEWKVFIQDRLDGNFQVARDGWIADYNDASSFTDMFQTKYKQNNSKYANKKYDALIVEAANEMNLRKRAEILQKASAIMMNDYPAVPLFTYVTTHLVKPYVGGYTGLNSQDKQKSQYFYITNRQTTAER
ncbi:peptide ABC transporter substrate-binding protein [Fluviispira multicolorata]|uniref:Peptide ABC transporter substrate-binding protein n=1 Tax=Fluviispira multicolorata TaxID=2654512 RepID=A0A833JEH7_9BACT|nr:peptide ABC transporter substrate-binding protein [Fluviispira multicolorata]KAB8032072.1 peptide ABC transporter substrate-binding protein [Fluviispira multicolorata]